MNPRRITRSVEALREQVRAIGLSCGGYCDRVEVRIWWTELRVPPLRVRFAASVSDAQRERVGAMVRRFRIGEVRP